MFYQIIMFAEPFLVKNGKIASDGQSSSVYRASDSVLQTYANVASFNFCLMNVSTGLFITDCRLNC